MFTTGNHLYLYVSIILYLPALILCLIKKNRTGYFFLFAGFAVNSLYLLGRGWLGGIFIMNPVIEGPYFLPWCLALIALFIGFTGKKDLCGIVLIPLIIFSFFSILYARGMLSPAPQKTTIWATLFFISEVFAHALFYCGASFAVFSIFKNKDDNLFHTFIICGFIAYSIAQVTGATWCYLGWGNTFRWGSRHLSSATIWVLYAAYLHLKFIQGWNLRKRAVFAIAAAALVVFISYGGYLHEMNFPRIGG